LIDLSDPNNYNIKISGAGDNSTIGVHYISASDYNLDGKLDIIASAEEETYDSRAYAGALYYINNSIFSQYIGKGKSFVLNSSSNYSIRYVGSSEMELFSSLDTTRVADLNGDSFPDLITGTGTWNNTPDYLDRIDAGFVYVIYNFPHSISITSATASTNLGTILGTVSAPNSPSKISGVEYQIDGNSSTGNWRSCIATDGAFDSNIESYTCNISDLNLLGHRVYLRTYDENGVYTISSRYASSVFSLAPGFPTTGLGENRLINFLFWLKTKILNLLN